jgi:hypothetical protein
MSDKIHQLHAIKPPTADDEIKESMIKMLEDTLAEARAGDITEVVMLIQHADPEEWSDRAGMTDNIMRWVGRLETTKLDWIAKYKEQDN